MNNASSRYLSYSGSETAISELSARAQAEIVAELRELEDRLFASISPSCGTPAGTAARQEGEIADRVKSWAELALNVIAASWLDLGLGSSAFDTQMSRVQAVLVELAVGHYGTLRVLSCPDWNSGVSRLDEMRAIAVAVRLALTVRAKGWSRRNNHRLLLFTRAAGAHETPLLAALIPDATLSDLGAICTPDVVPAYPNRAKWLELRLLERGWSPNEVWQRWGGPDRKTIGKILRGSWVTNATLEKLCLALSKKFAKVDVGEIPTD
jgi:hypothetical protein